MKLWACHAKVALILAKLKNVYILEKSKLAIKQTKKSEIKMKLLDDLSHIHMPGEESCFVA